MPDPNALPRRSLLKLGLIGSALLAGGGYLATRLTDGTPIGRLPQARHLDAAAQTLLAKVFEAVLDAMLPADARQREALVTAAVGGLDQGLGRMPLHIQRELKDLLGLLALAPARALLTGRWRGWAAATVPETQALLTGLRTSSVELRRLVYVTVHDLATASYYALPQTWAAIGYRGPIAPGPGVDV